MNADKKNLIDDMGITKDKINTNIGKTPISEIFDQVEKKTDDKPKQNKNSFMSKFGVLKEFKLNDLMTVAIVFILLTFPEIRNKIQSKIQIDDKKYLYMKIIASILLAVVLRFGILYFNKNKKNKDDTTDCEKKCNADANIDA